MFSPKEFHAEWLHIYGPSGKGGYVSLAAVEEARHRHRILEFFVRMVARNRGLVGFLLLYHTILTGRVGARGRRVAIESFETATIPS